MSNEDQFDKMLLGRIHVRVPLVREPYAQLAEQLCCSEERVLARLRILRAEGGVVREISGIFELPALGYRQTLVAMKVPPQRTDEAARLTAAHPGVSHCYTRTGGYNLWFTLATSPTSRFGLERTARILARRTRAEAHILLPVIKRYKLRVPLDPHSPAEELPEPPHPPGESDQRTCAPPQLTDDRIAAIRSLQIDLPNRSDPFAPLAAASGFETDMLLIHAADLLGAGYMRRYAAVLYHRRTGSEANVLVAWRTDRQDAEKTGALCKDIPAVSHCYLRGGAAEDWSYGLYTMIHGRCPEDARRTINQIATAADLKEYVELWTVREYKKRRISLFGDEEQRWEATADEQ